MTPKMLPVGLALSGGTARSVTHIGVIKALTEAGIPIDRIAGTSGGSIVGALYASGMPMSSMLQVAREMSWSKLVSIKLSRLGVISSRRIEEFVKSVIGDIGFEDLMIPVYVVATDLETGVKRVFDKGPLARIIRASCSIPQIFLPVEIDGRYYVDGGFSEYLPVGTLQEMGDVFVIGVNLAHQKSYFRRPRNYLQLAIHITGLVARTNYVASEEKADVLIHPDLDLYSSFDFNSASDMIDIGYETTKALVPEILQKWKHKSSRIQQLIQRLSRRPEPR